jgi:DNA-binding GntR family transcriptional regulator
MTGPPERRYVSKSDLVTDSLRDMISEGELPPGSPLRQRELAERFDVSPTPVREALRRLEAEALVVFDAHRAVTVATPSVEEMEENHQILAALEALAGSLAVPRITDADLVEITDLHQQIAASSPGDPQLVELNRRFHFRIYECTGSPTLLLLMRLLWRSFPNGPQRGRPLRESVAQHAKLLQALGSRDPDAVAAVIKDHALGSIAYLHYQPPPEAAAKGTAKRPI